MVMSLAVVVLAGCAGGATEHARDVRGAQDATAGNLTVGTVQKEIRVGMSGAEVAAVLGSPNMVSTDDKRREVWIYDRVATDVAYSSSVSGFFGTDSSGAASQSQKTLTVIIKFDENKTVRDFAYHSSKF